MQPGECAQDPVQRQGVDRRIVAGPFPGNQLIREVGRQDRDARSVGVDVLFAPVLDVRSEPRNPIVGNRAFGWDPDRVSDLGAAFVRGAVAGGCRPTGKHWPGHGATTADSHDAIPSVADHLERLLERDFPPFLAALDAGCPAFMTAHVAYPALDPLGSILTETAITVQAPSESMVTVQRGFDRESYSCTPDCQPSLLLGDATKYFSDVGGQAGQRNQLATSK